MTLPMFLLLFVICVNIVVGSGKNVFTSEAAKRGEENVQGTKWKDTNETSLSNEQNEKPFSASCDLKF